MLVVNLLIVNNLSFVNQKARNVGKTITSNPREDQDREMEI